jgi:uncharacterized membrane protein
MFNAPPACMLIALASAALLNESKHEATAVHIIMADGVQ